MIVHSLDIKKDMLHPKKDDEEILSPKCLYMGAICALLYLTRCTCQTTCLMRIVLLDITLRQHAKTRMVLKTPFVTLRVSWE